MIKQLSATISGVLISINVSATASVAGNFAEIITKNSNGTVTSQAIKVEDELIKKISATSKDENCTVIFKGDPIIATLNSIQNTITNPNHKILRSSCEKRINESEFKDIVAICGGNLSLSYRKNPTGYDFTIRNPIQDLINGSIVNDGEIVVKRNLCSD